MKSKAELPPYASMNTRIQHKLNNNAANSTLKVYRMGWRYMWGVAAKTMRKCGVKKPGTFDKKNCHGGEMWGWPHEMNLTNARARKIMFAVIESNKLNLDKLKIVRKSLGYAWKMHSGKTRDQLDDKNWPCMARIWKTIDPFSLPGKTRIKPPMRIPTVNEMETAFKTPWKADHPWPLGKFCQGTIAAYDTFIWGCRSFEDHDRIKRSMKHVVRPSEGYIATAYKGGRCKTPGFPRAWTKYTVCMCPGKKHRSPPPLFKDTVVDGEPKQGVNWCTTCPVACLEYIWTHDKAKGRTYSKCHKDGAFGVKNEGDIPKLAIEWMCLQGVCNKDDPYSHESGRKALAEWCSEYEVEYRHSFQIHADLPQTWKDNYQFNMERTTFKDRNQSKDPKTCMVALRTLTNNWKLGPRKKSNSYGMSRKERFEYHLLRERNPVLADRIKMNLPSESDSDSDLPPKVEVKREEEEQKMQPTPRRAKRKRSVVKEEPYDPEFFLRPPAPKRRKRKPAPKPKPEPKKRKKPTPKPKPKQKKRNPAPKPKPKPKKRRKPMPKPKPKPKKRQKNRSQNSKSQKRGPSKRKRRL